MPMNLRARGVIFPERLPTLARYSPDESVADLIQWFWLPRWELPEGQVLTQDVLPFPSANLTCEEQGVRITGPSTALSRQELQGSGWALGVLLQPAGLAALEVPPSVNTTVSFALPIEQEIVRSMAAGADLEAVQELSAWFAQLGAPSPRALEANRLLRVASGTRGVTTADGLADAMHLSVRTVQRLARDFIGMTPLMIIRRYRLQEVADLLRGGSQTIANIAARAGYADHAHLTRDFRRIFGFGPREYRELQL